MSREGWGEEVSSTCGSQEPRNLGRRVASLTELGSIADITAVPDPGAGTWGSGTWPPPDETQQVVRAAVDC